MRCGIHPKTGELVFGIEAVKASIIDILETPIGSCTMRRDYGSLLYRLTDRPMDATFISDFYQATVVAILMWEDEVRPLRVQMDVSGWNQGRAVLDLTLVYTPTGEIINLDGIVLNVSK